MARGDYRWRITIPDDGTLPGKGVVPTLIQWDVPRIPPTRCRSRACRSRGSPPRIRSPRRSAARSPRWGSTTSLPVTYDRDARLAAMLRTPRGIVTL